MRGLFLAALAMFLATAVHSQTPNDGTQPEDEIKFFMAAQACANANTVFQSMQQYQEQPLLSGLGNLRHISGTVFSSNIVLFVNQDTGTWSLVALYEDFTACIVAEGSEFEPYVRDTIAQQ